MNTIRGDVMKSRFAICLRCICVHIQIKRTLYVSTIGNAERDECENGEDFDVKNYVSTTQYEVPKAAEVPKNRLEN